MDVLLVSAPPKSNLEFSVNILQMELTASCLGKKGFTTEIYDGSAYGLNTRQLANVILRKEFSVLGCFVAQDSALSTLQVVRRVREAGWSGHLSLLGNYASKMYKTLLGNQCGIDSIVIGRDDVVLSDLANKTQRGEAWSKIAGLAFFSPEQGIVVNKGGYRNVNPEPQVTFNGYQNRSLQKVNALPKG